jgi:hypothetical protein
MPKLEAVASLLWSMETKTMKKAVSLISREVELQTKLRVTPSDLSFRCP